MIRWREKLFAFALHFLLTGAVALVAAALVFLVWYPAPFDDMIGGTRLFLLVVGCDLALGPLISLVIYDSRKSRAKLLFDYSLVGIVQVAALIYGVSVMADSRPVFIAFVGDRLEVVSAGDLDEADLAAAPNPAWRQRPRWGAQLVSTDVPLEKHNEVLMSSLAGKDVQVLPRYYVPYEAKLDRIRARSAPLAELERKRPEAVPLVAAALAEHQLTPQEVGWLPVRHARGFWTALMERESGRPLAYLPVDPY